jgi:hypothetical protein
VRTRKFLIIVLVVVSVASAATWASYRGYRRIHPTSLDAWAAEVARPGFTLRYRTRTSTHMVAVFDAGGDRLAFCRQRISGAPTPEEQEVRITDVAGNDVADPSRPRELLVRRWDLGLTEYSVEDGELVSVRPEFHGRMRIVFDASLPGEGPGDSPDRKPVLDVHIQWGLGIRD